MVNSYCIGPIVSSKRCRIPACTVCKFNDIAWYQFYWRTAKKSLIIRYCSTFTKPPPRPTAGWTGATRRWRAGPPSRASRTSPGAFQRPTTWAERLRSSSRSSRRPCPAGLCWAAPSTWVRLITSNDLTDCCPFRRASRLETDPF